MSAATAVRPDPPAVDPRIQARRDEVRRSHRRRRRVQLGVLAAVVAAGALAWVVTHSPVLDVDRVQIDATEHVPADQIAEVAGVRPGDDLIDVDPGTVRRRLLTLPWVADAEVAVDWTGGDVHLTITERTPVAAVPDGAGAWTLVDDTGRTIAAAPAGAPPVVAIEGLAPAEPGADLGAGASVPLEIVNRLGPGLRTRIISVVVAPDGSLQLKARPEALVQLCTPDNIDAKLRSLTTFFAQVDDTDLATVNVCVPGSPTATRRAKTP